MSKVKWECDCERGSFDAWYLGFRLLCCPNEAEWYWSVLDSTGNVVMAADYHHGFACVTAREAKAMAKMAATFAFSHRLMSVAAAKGAAKQEGGK